MVLRVTNGFNRLSDDNLVVKANQIKLAITENTENFPSPSPSMATLATAIGNFTKALSKAEGGSNLDKAVKNDMREIVISLLHKLGNYVIFAADGDRTKAQSSGFGIANAPSPGGPLTKPVNLQLTEGDNAGEIKGRFKRVVRSRCYIIQYAEETMAAAGYWQTQVSTKCKFTLRQLQSGNKYMVRVAAVGINEQIIYSEPVFKIAQ